MGCFNLSSKKKDNAELIVSRKDCESFSITRKNYACLFADRSGFVSFSASLICSVIGTSSKTWLYDTNGIALYAVDGTPLGYRMNE